MANHSSPFSLSLWCSVVALALVPACGSSGGVKTDAGNNDGDANQPGGDTGIVDVEPDTTTAETDGAQPEAPAADVSPEPDVAPQPGVGRRLLAGAVALVGSGPDSCTRQFPASGDRWCAFARVPSPPAAPEPIELWVINVSQAIAGVDIKCDTTDANCLRLSSNLSFEDMPYDAFEGDTLIFYADNNSQTGGFKGPISAWRPGWTAARHLTSATGVVCRGHATAPVAHCYENGVTTATQITYDLLAGALPAEGGGPLPKVENLLLVEPSDPPGTRKYGVWPSVAGDSIAWSSRLIPGGTETLKFQKLNDDASRKVVADDVARWEISSDGTKYYWLRGYNYDTSGADSGTLQMAPFPDGVAPTTLMAGVGDFAGYGPKAIVFRTGKVVGGVGDLKVIADRDDPGTVKTLDTGVLAVWGVAPDGSEAIYSKTQDFNLGTFDLHLNTLTAAAPCTLVAENLAAPFGIFSPSGVTASWARYDLQTGLADAYYAPVGTCTPTRFASNITNWNPIGDEGYIWENDRNDNDQGTIQYGRFVDGQLPIAGTIVDTLASAWYAILLPSHPVIVYTIFSNGVRDGLYISSNLPFSN